MGKRKGRLPFYPLLSEIGALRKDKKGRVAIALVYPNRYAVAMSNLGFQTVYRILNELEAVVCERAFLPDEDSRGHVCIRSVESNRPISDFDIIAFSISFESDYLHLVSIIKKSGLPIFAKERSSLHPLIVAGGVACFLNPEPVAEFMDCFLIGEAEMLLSELVTMYTRYKSRHALLTALANDVQGAYIPKFYTPVYNPDGTLHDFESSRNAPEKIKRAYVTDISKTSTCTTILTPNTTFKNTFLIEVGRGCPHGCRFCSAGYVYRPPRFRPISELKNDIETGTRLTERIGLAGAAISDVPDIDRLCEFASRKNVRVSFSSLRADALTPDLLSALKQSQVKTATIAPDGGSERMRRIINKHLNERQVLQAVQTLVINGIPNLKLYFMVGLPYETSDDIQELIELCKKIKAVFLETSREKRRIGNITISLNPFIPKPFTPFQWAGMNSETAIKAKIKKIRTELRRIPNLRVHAENPRQAFIQALLSRGDRKLSELLVLADKNNGNWSKTLKEARIDTQFYVTRQRSSTEILPWDFIEHGIDKAFLIREYQKAGQEIMSAPCPMKSCRVCGVCE